MIYPVQKTNPPLIVTMAEKAFDGSITRLMINAPRGSRLLCLHGKSSWTLGIAPFRSSGKSVFAFYGGCRKGLENSRHRLQPGFPFREVFHREQHRVPQFLYRIEKYALVCTAERVLVEMIAQKRHMIVEHDTRCGNGEEHRRERYVRVTCFHLGMKRVFARHRATLGNVDAAVS